LGHKGVCTGMKDTIIIILVFLSAGLCIWCLWLDSKNQQLEGYIKRLEREAISGWNVRGLGDEFAKQQRAERNEL